MFDKRIKKHIHELCLQSGMRRKEFEDKVKDIINSDAGLTFKTPNHSTINRWYNGETVPKDCMIPYIAKALDVSEEEIRLGRNPAESFSEPESNKTDLGYEKNKSILLESYEKYHSSLLCKEIALGYLKDQRDFSYDELKILIEKATFFAYDYIPFSSDFIKAWVDINGSISRDTFPERFYRDPELVYYIISRTNTFSAKMEPYITEKMLFDFSKNCSNEDLVRLGRRLGYYSQSYENRYNNFFNDIEIKKRLKSIDPKSVKYTWMLVQDEHDEVTNKKREERNKLDESIKLGVVNKNSISKSLPLVFNETEISKTKSHKIATVNNDEKRIIIHYISDLHLNSKIIDKQKDGVSIGETAMEEIKLAVSQIAKSIKHKNDFDYKKVILLGGDITEDFEISRAFHHLLSKELNYSCTVLSILGNHELWDGDPLGSKRHNLLDIYKKYEEMIDGADHSYLLENSVFAIVQGWKICITEEMLFDESIEIYLKRILSKAELIVFGATGFSGNNDNFNASHGIYRGTIINATDDKKLSEKCEKAYTRAIELIGSNEFVCLTHMPKADWSDNVYLPNCIYISGHTHQNSYTLENGKRILADNQIGYEGNDYSLKNFLLYGHSDYFESLPDGIHEIHPSEYIEFSESRNLRYRYKRNDSSKLYALKKSGFYMFVTQNKYNTCILCGGSKKKLSSNRLDYYYDNLDILAEQLLSSFQGYEKRIHEISESIQKLGGDGKIHGCIVDIDFFNHVYLNPFDGTLTFYCAEDTMSRITYPTLNLLVENNPSNSFVLDNMKKQIKTGIVKNGLVISFDGIVQKGGAYSKGSYIYKISAKAKRIQSLFDGNVIQIWDDSLIDMSKRQMVASKKSI